MATTQAYEVQEGSLPVSFSEVARQQLHSEIIADFSRVEELSVDWDRMWKADPMGEIFQSFAWNRAWWRAYGRDLALRCAVVWNNGKVIGILPLVRQDRTLRVLGAPQFDYTDILAEESDVGSVLTIALRTLSRSGDWQECTFEHLSAQSRIVRYCKGLPAELSNTLCLVPARHSPTIFLHQESGALSKLADKKHLRRHQTKLEKSGALNFRFLPTRDEIQKHLPMFVQYQIRRRVLQGQESDCQRPEFSELLRFLVEELDPQEQLRFGLLEWNGRPLAYHLGFQVNNKFTMYQQAFDVDAWELSPGEVLLRQLFLYGAEHVSREFDFSVGYEFYKSRFANHQKENFTLYLQHPGLFCRARRWRRQVEGRLLKPALKLKSAVRTNPAIFGRVKFIRKWAFDLRSKAWLRNFIGEPRPGAGAPRVAQGREQVSDDRRTNTRSDFAQLNIQVTPARLSDLADLHLERPGFRLATRFSTYKERLKNHDRAYIVRSQGEPLLLLWTRTSTAPNAESPAGPGESKSNALYDYTYLGKDQNRPPYAAVLSMAAEFRII